MPSVAFVSPKGGAGKTTAALLLALGLAERGQRVAMIDSDPNKPLIYWASLPGRPNLVSVHPAPTLRDVPDALREARPRNPDWIILDTEGSIRGAMAFTALRLDLILTPLAGSHLEAIQALKASEMVETFTSRSDRPPRHRALLTRVPAAIRARSLATVVEQLRSNGMELLPTALIEKEAFRSLFSIGGGFDEMQASGISGVDSALQNVRAYVQVVMDTVAQTQTA